MTGKLNMSCGSKWFALTSILAATISSYLVYVDWRLTKNPDYHPMCDIAENVSCSKAIQSPIAHPFSYMNVVKQGSLFDVSLCKLATVFYAGMATYPLFSREAPAAYLALSSSSVLASVYGTFLLATQVKDFCPACLALYAANVGLLASAAYDQWIPGLKTKMG